MNKKNKIKAGVIFGIAMSLFYVLQDLLTHDNLTTKKIIISVVSTLVGGALGGILFGWLIGRFANSKLFTIGTQIVTGLEETILFETGASHFKGVEGVGGKLYLTNKRLVFKSHKFNIQNHELSINLSDLNKVERYRTLGIVSNGLSVVTTHKKTEKFAVEQPGEWISKLLEKSVLQ